MQLRKLKAGTIYMHKRTGDIGVLKRGDGLFKPAKQWELDFVSSVMPEELNSHFRKILKTDYVVIGEL